MNKIKIKEALRIWKKFGENEEGVYEDELHTYTVKIRDNKKYICVELNHFTDEVDICGLGCEFNIDELPKE